MSADKVHSLFWWFLSLCPAASCSTMSSFQDAHVLDPGKAHFFVAASTQTAVFDTSKITKNDGDPRGGPLGSTLQLESGARIGIFDGLDFGIRLTFVQPVAADIKFRLFQSGRSAEAIAFGYGGGFGSDSPDSIHGAHWNSRHRDFFLPYYWTRALTEEFDLTAAPRFSLRQRQITHLDPTPGVPESNNPQEGENIGKEYHYFAPMLGVNLTISPGVSKPGTRLLEGIIMEAGYHRSLEGAEVQSHFGVGWVLGHR